MNSEISNPDFSLLPAQIITQILRYLHLKEFKNACCVCKSWHYASTDPLISKTLILVPAEEDIPEICKINRRFGVLSIDDECVELDQMDSYYFQLYEKFCPFIYELRIHHSGLKFHHLLKLLELTKRLENISLYGDLTLIPCILLPLDYDYEAKNQIIKNLAGVKKIMIGRFINFLFIADLVGCTPNLEFITLEVLSETHHYTDFLKLFFNDNASKLRHLDWTLELDGYADDFLKCFVKLKNLNLRSFKLSMEWEWENGVYNSYLFSLFTLKLKSLVQFHFNNVLNSDQLSLICQNLVNLKKFDCILEKDVAISQLSNLTKLEKLQCSLQIGTPTCWIEIDKFFKCKFQHLQIFDFDGLVTGPNLVHLCENHPNLIKLKLKGLVIRDLEIIFKCLTKLRHLDISFDIERSTPEIMDYLKDVPLVDSDRQYEYRISRLHDLEFLYLTELVQGIRDEDVKQLKKLRISNFYCLKRK